MHRRFITAEEAISLLPDKEQIHTFYDMPFGLLGADWSRDEVVAKFKKSTKIELTGQGARELGHGVAAYDVFTKLQSEVLFVETDQTKLDAFDPWEAADE